MYSDWTLLRLFQGRMRMKGPNVGHSIIGPVFFRAMIGCSTSAQRPLLWRAAETGIALTQQTLQVRAMNIRWRHEIERTKLRWPDGCNLLLTIFLKPFLKITSDIQKKFISYAPSLLKEKVKEISFPAFFVWNDWPGGSHCTTQHQIEADEWEHEWTNSTLGGREAQKSQPWRVDFVHGLVVIRNNDIQELMHNIGW